MKSDSTGETQPAVRNGFPVFPLTPQSRPTTSEDVREAEEEADAAYTKNERTAAAPPLTSGFARP